MLATVLANLLAANLFAAISYDPIVHVELGPLRVSPHGVGIAVGFLAGARLLLPQARRKGVGEDDVYSLLTRAAIGAIIGARLAYVINHVGDYDSVVEALKVWEGGISLLGGFLGAVALAMPEMRRRRLSFWVVMDAAAPGMALGVLVGRIGDLIVGDHLGTPTSFFLGYRCPAPGVETASPCIPGQVVHQTALYDFILVSFLLAGLLLLRRRPRYDGFLITVFAAWYATQRIIEDFLREDKRYFDVFTGSQLTSIFFLTLGLWHLLFVRRTPRWGRWDERPPEPGEGGEADEGGEPGEPGEPGDELSPAAEDRPAGPGPERPSEAATAGEAAPIEAPTMAAPPDREE